MQNKKIVEFRTIDEMQLHERDLNFDVFSMWLTSVKDKINAEGLDLATAYINIDDHSDDWTDTTIRIVAGRPETDKEYEKRLERDRIYAEREEKKRRLAKAKAKERKAKQKQITEAQERELFEQLRKKYAFEALPMCQIDRCGNKIK